MILRLPLGGGSSLMLGQGLVRSQIGLWVEESWVYALGSWGLWAAGFLPSLKRKYS